EGLSANLAHVAEQAAAGAAARNASHATAINGLAASLAEQQALHEQTVHSVEQLSQEVSANLGHMMETTAASASAHDASQEAALNGLAASLAEQQALHEHNAHAVAQLAQDVSAGLGHVMASTAAGAAERDASHEAVMNGLAASLADQQALHEHMLNT